ncbi:Ig-like domain-containing protein [Brevibacillus sp. SYSU BS000544]|uniref:Ig-like domain-containing protein n=1 Tax=Brevibacillus sp. SYSU BS000544 TaxID=3416443 RepID=UPI003CE50EA2
MRISRLLLSLFAFVMIFSTVLNPVIAASQESAVEQEATLDHLEASVTEIVLAPKKSVEFQVYAVSKDGDKEEKLDITKNEETEYESGKTSLITVDQGKATATSKSGETKITVTYKDLTLEIPVTVSKTAIVSLDPVPTVFVNVSKKQKVTVKARQADNKAVDVTKDVEWKIDDEEIATISKGEVTGKAEGTATVTATYKGKSVDFAVQVISDKKISKLTASKSKVTISVDQEADVKITVQYTDKKTEDVTSKVYWKVDKADIVAVVNGKLVGKKAGVAKATAKYADKEVKITVTVASSELIDRQSISAKEQVIIGGIISKYTITGKVATGSELSVDFNGKKTEVEVDSKGEFKFTGSAKGGIKDFTLIAEKDGVQETYKGTFGK